MSPPNVFLLQEGKFRAKFLQGIEIPDRNLRQFVYGIPIIKSDSQFKNFKISRPKNLSLLPTHTRYKAYN